MRLTTLGLARASYVVVAALFAATLLPRLGVPAPWVPDLVVIGVVATAVVRGPVHGALAGLVSGWVVELVPPVGSPLGLTALTVMAAGALAGAFRRPSSRSYLRPLAALAAAGTLVVAAGLASSVVAEGGFVVGDGVTRLGATLAAGLLVLPALLAADRALVRRRLG